MLIAVVALVCLVVNTQLLVWQLRRRDDVDDGEELTPAVGITLEPFPEAWWDESDSDTLPVGFTAPRVKYPGDPFGVGHKGTGTGRGGEGRRNS